MPEGILVMTARSRFPLRRLLISSAKQLFFYCVDFAVLFSAILSAYYIYKLLGMGRQDRYSMPGFLFAAIAVSCTTILVLMLSGAYEKHSSLLNVEETNRFIKGITFSALLISVAIVFSKIQLSRYVLALSYVFSVVFIVIEKLLFYHFLPKSRSFWWINRRVLIYGAGVLGQSIFRAIANSPKLDIRAVGFVDDNVLLSHKEYHSSTYGQNGSSLGVLGTGADLSALIERHAVDEVIVAISNIKDDKLVRIRNHALSSNAGISFVPNLHRNLLHRMKIQTIGQIPLVQEEECAAYSLYDAAKRVMDISLAVFLLLLGLPLWLMIAAAIKLDSEGTIIFSQVRVGKNGRRFNMLKFRSMRAEAAPYAVSPKSSADERITRVGKWLRRSSLDELPQIINIIRGDMSFVGPRPEMPFIAERYTELEGERLRVLPGITGLWQLSGDRNKAIHENIDYDLYYITHRSLFLDIAIMIETCFFACRGK